MSHQHAAILQKVFINQSAWDRSEMQEMKPTKELFAIKYMAPDLMWLANRNALCISIRGLMNPPVLFLLVLDKIPTTLLPPFCFLGFEWYIVTLCWDSDVTLLITPLVMLAFRKNNHWACRTSDNLGLWNNYQQNTSHIAFEIVTKCDV